MSCHNASKTNDCNQKVRMQTKAIARVKGTRGKNQCALNDVLNTVRAAHCKPCWPLACRRSAECSQQTCSRARWSPEDESSNIVQWADKYSKTVDFNACRVLYRNRESEREENQCKRAVERKSIVIQKNIIRKSIK